MSTFLVRSFCLSTLLGGKFWKRLDWYFAKPIQKGGARWKQWCTRIPPNFVEFGKKSKLEENHFLWYRFTKNESFTCKRFINKNIIAYVRPKLAIHLLLLLKKFFIFVCFTKLDHKQGPWYASGHFEANKSYKAYNLINKFILATWRLQIKFYSKMNSSYIKISAPGGIPTPPGSPSSSSTSHKLQ